MASAAPEQQPSLIRTVKLPHDRLRSLATKLYSLHRQSLAPPPPKDPITIVCVSDTHGTQPPLPPGDVLLHAGDLSVWGSLAEIQEQLNWLDAQPHAQQVVIAGNHDLLFDTDFQRAHPEIWYQAIKASVGVNSEDDPAVEECISQTAGNLIWGNVKYLQNESLELKVTGGRVLKIYGSPDTPLHGLSAFQYPRADDVWSHRIPADTDIIVTHGPPWGHLDGIKKSGCPFLARAVTRVRPRLVLCGHIHVGYGREEKVLDGVGQAHEAILGQWEAGER